MIRILKNLPRKILGNPFFFVVLFILLITPLVINNRYVLHTMILIFFYAALGSAWNILGGYAGQFSFGHVAFFGLGAYTSTLLFIGPVPPYPHEILPGTGLGLSPWIGMLAAGAVAALFSGLIGFATFKLRGVFYAMSTLALAEIVRIMVTGLRQYTRGSVGILIPFSGSSLVNMQFVERWPFYYIALGIMLLGIFVTFSIDKSKFGLQLRALKENEIVSQSLGINTFRCKLAAAAISGFITGMAGTLYAQYFLWISPETVLVSDFSVRIVLVACLGGLGTILGPVVGSAILVSIQELARVTFGSTFIGLHMVVYTILLIFIVMWHPTGFMSLFKKLYYRFFA